jgi:hypothetical protein
VRGLVREVLVDDLRSERGFRRLGFFMNPSRRGIASAATIQVAIVLRARAAF